MSMPNPFRTSNSEVASVGTSRMYASNAIPRPYVSDDILCDRTDKTNNHPSQTHYLLDISSG